MDFTARAFVFSASSEDFKDSVLQEFESIKAPDEFYYEEFPLPLGSQTYPNSVAIHG